MSPGQSVEQIERDRWSTPEQAREYGLVDHVVASAAALPVLGPAGSA